MTTWPAANRIPAMDTSFDGETKSRAEREHWFGQLTAAHGAPLLRLAQSYTRNARDAEDLAQDIWLAISLSMRGCRGAPASCSLET